MHRCGGWVSWVMGGVGGRGDHCMVLHSKVGGDPCMVRGDRLCTSIVSHGKVGGDQLCTYEHCIARCGVGVGGDQAAHATLAPDRNPPGETAAGAPSSMPDSRFGTFASILDLCVQSETSQTISTFPHQDMITGSRGYRL